MGRMKTKTYPKRDPNRCPTHPGAMLREIILPELHVTRTELAKALKMSRQHPHAILRERQPVTPETAVKLQAALAEPRKPGSTCRPPMICGMRRAASMCRTSRPCERPEIYRRASPRHLP